MSDTEADEAAIRELLEHERRITWSGDFEGYSATNVHAPYVARWHASAVTGIFVVRGWDEIEPRMRESASNRRRSQRPPDTGVVEDLVIRVSGDLAWLTHTRRYPDTPEHRASPEPAHHVRILERQDGKWKFVFLGYLDPGMSNPGSARIRLAVDGTVLWMDPVARESLAADNDLVLRAGKLRLRDARAQQRLTAAIAWAAGHDRGVVPGRGALPVVLERGAGLAIRVLWVLADGGAVHLSLGDAHRDAQRLDAAAAVFGLSEAQRVVAGHIVEGMPLPEVARTMGLRPTTVRTHLDRMFEKTGVRNQTALVRVLLSSAAPL